MSGTVDMVYGAGWELSSSGLPRPPKPFHDMSNDEWEVFIEAFLTCATEKVKGTVDESASDAALTPAP